MNLNKDPSSYAKIPPVLVATWAPSEVQTFVGLALADIATLAKEVERLSSQVELTAWQPIETAPKDGSFIHVWFPENGNSLSSHCLTCRWRDDAWFSQNGGLAFNMGTNASHWKRIEPPVTRHQSETK